MKRVLATIFVLCMTATVITGCAATPTQEVSLDDYRRVSAELTALKEKHKELQEKYDILLDMYAEYKTEVVMSGYVPQSEGVEAAKPTTPLTEVKLYDDDYVTISYRGCEAVRDEYNVVLIVENKTDVPLTIGDNSIAVDGWNLSDAFANQEIAAKSKGFVKVRTKELQSLTPSKISGSLYVADKSKTLWGYLSYDAIFAETDIIGTSSHD